MISVNARSLRIEKSDELLCVAQMNDVSCVCVTETWFKGFMSPESVGLAGFCCERKDREDRRGGGVACYVAASMVYTRLRYIEDDEQGVLWVRLRPQKLPRKYSCIIIACIYHPPKADNGSMREYRIISLDSNLRCYPECGIILTGDFNQLRDSFLRVHYEYRHA